MFEFDPLDLVGGYEFASRCSRWNLFSATACANAYHFVTAVAATLAATNLSAAATNLSAAALSAATLASSISRNLARDKDAFLSFGIVCLEQIMRTNATESEKSRHIINWLIVDMWA